MVTKKSIPSALEPIVEVAIERELQDYNSSDELNQENAVKIVTKKSIPSALEPIVEVAIERELQDYSSDELNQENAVKIVTKKSIPSALEPIVEVAIERELQDYDSSDELNQDNAIEMVSKSIPSTSEIIIEATIEKELQDLNNNPDLNEDNVIAMMSKFIPSTKNSSDVNYQHSRIINLGSYVFAQGYTLLHIAAALNCDKIADCLIKAGADVDLQNSDGCTPLHYAAMCGSTEAAKVLIANEADIDAQDCFEREPLYYALKYNNLRTAKFLLDNDADRSDLHIYITKTSKWKCVLSASIASITAIVVTSSVLFYTTNLPMFSIIGATISSTLMFGTITYGLVHTWSIYATNSKLDKVECDDITPLSPQPA